MTTFTDEEYAKMEVKAKSLLGWTFQEKCGMTIKEMIENPEKGKQALVDAKATAGFVDKIKIEKVLSYLKDPNWKQVLKNKLA